MKNILILVVIMSHIFSYEIYKEIKIENVDDELVSTLHLLNVEIDHVHIENDNSIKFAISESDLVKIQTYNIPYTVIHENLEEFYASRLTNDYESRDFELGSMGGYLSLIHI